MTTEEKGKFFEKREIEKTYFEYLDALRDSGKTNMFGARPYLQKKFGLSVEEASRILALWMSTYSERHPR